MSNLVQAEFFLVDVRASSLNKMLSECVERRQEESPIKACIRFYDDDGSITPLAFESARLEKRSVEILDAFQSSAGLRRWRLNWESRTVAGQKLQLQPRAQRLVVKRLVAVIKSGSELAIEQEDHHFRLAKNDEVHELLESARRAKGIWVFVFANNILLSDKNTLLGWLH